MIEKLKGDDKKDEFIEFGLQYVHALCEELVRTVVTRHCPAPLPLLYFPRVVSRSPHFTLLVSAGSVQPRTGAALLFAQPV